MTDRAPGLEIATIDGTQIQIGRDPRTMTGDELQALGHVAMPVLDAIRARCVDCCAGVAIEVRRCTAVFCPSWPFRMGKNPWRAKVEMSDERRAAMVERMAKMRASQVAEPAE